MGGITGWASNAECTIKDTENHGDIVINSSNVLGAGGIAGMLRGENIDGCVNTGTMTVQNAISQGHGFEQAQQVAVSSLDSTLQMQGLLLSVKDILGMMMVAALVVAVVSAFIPFHKTVRVKVVKTGEDMV